MEKKPEEQEPLKPAEKATIYPKLRTPVRAWRPQEHR